jgi:hypothetical protein
MSTSRYWRAWWGMLSLTERVIVVIVTLLAILAVMLVICSEPFREAHAEGPITIGQEIASNNALIALIITMPAVIGIIAPIVGAVLHNKDAAKIRAEDRAERAAVADQAAHAAALLLAAQRDIAAKAEEAAVLLKANTTAVAATAVQTQGQLSQIHTLVNSNLTLANKLAMEATKAALVATRAQRGFMPPGAERDHVDVRIRALEIEIGEMEMALSERIEAAEAANSKVSS